MSSPASTGYASRDAILWGLCTAFLFTLILNGPAVASRVRGDPPLIRMGNNVDAEYYAALIARSGAGRWNLGNVSMKEHRDAPDVASDGPKVQGMLMRIFGWDIATAIGVGHLLFPFLIILLFSVAFSHLLQSVLAGSATALFAASFIGTGLLRPINPQITLVIIAAYLLLFFTRPASLRLLFARGLVIASLFFLHIVLAPFLLATELLDALLRLRKRISWREQVLAAIAIALPVCVAAIAKMLLLSQADPAILADTNRRLGMIPSHLPAAPLLQGTILCTLLAVWLMKKSGRIRPQQATTLLILLTALLLALNQSLLHGIDIMFGSYYALPATVVLATAWCAIFLHLIPPRLRTLAGTALAAVGILLLSLQTMEQLERQAQEARQWNTSIDRLLERLRAIPEELVVLAPLDIADLIPVFTHHFVVFNRYTYYDYVGDAELAERYLLKEALYPTADEQVDRTYGSVLGVYAGNLAARKRTLDHPSCLLDRSRPMCQPDIRSFIFHQDLLAILDSPSLDLQTLLRKYHVDLIISDHPLPAALRSVCREQSSLTPYTIWSCDGAS